MLDDSSGCEGRQGMFTAMRILRRGLLIVVLLATGCGRSDVSSGTASQSDNPRATYLTAAPSPTFPATALADAFQQADVLAEAQPQVMCPPRLDETGKLAVGVVGGHLTPQLLSAARELPVANPSALDNALAQSLLTVGPCARTLGDLREEADRLRAAIVGQREVQTAIDADTGGIILSVPTVDAAARRVVDSWPGTTPIIVIEIGDVRYTPA